MTEQEYLIEKGGQREYVHQADLAARLKDGWEVLGHRTVEIGATVPQTKAPAQKSKPEGKAGGKKSQEAESEEAD